PAGHRRDENRPGLAPKYAVPAGYGRATTVPGPISAIRRSPASAQVRSRSASRQRSTCRTPSAPANASPYTNRRPPTPRRPPPPSRPGAVPGVDHPRPPAGGGPPPGQPVRRGGRAAQLPPAVVGHHHATDPAVGGPPGVVRVQDPLEQDRQRGHRTQPGQ